MELNKRIVFKRALPLFIGALLGYSYYFFIGCRSGACPISGNPYISTIYGGLTGLIFSFQGNKSRKAAENEKQ
jgi:hypothetical protein